MNLIIVESPTKARTLRQFLGSEYRIEASMGHIRDLPENRLGIDIERDFTPEYIIADEKKATVEALREAASKAEKVILATDPDREGEAIAWHLEYVVSQPGLTIQRITFHEITRKAIEEALVNPGGIDRNLVDAQQARRVLDRLVGYKLSPVLWRKVRRGLSAGRVQSVAVRLIVDREREILAFQSREYWEVLGKFEADGRQFEAKLQKVEIKTKEEADKLVEVLKTGRYTVADIQTKEVRRGPYPPFTTSTLQQAAANLFGWPAKKTMSVAQKLYEEGLITYHRTDSTNLAKEAVAQAREFIGREYGKDYLPEEPRFFKTKSKVAQEAHEAIRPTAVDSSQSAKIQTKDEKRLYELIWKRFLACQMAEAVYRQTAVDIVTLFSTPEGYLFRANGNEVIFDGWRKLFALSKNDKDETADKTAEEGENFLPKLSTGEEVRVQELIPTQHFTEPPPRYTEASLIKALEEYGIGRPSTYAPIITTICERRYVEREDRRLAPTTLGIAVNDFLSNNFPEIMDYQFTAKMEDDLDAIANGQKQWVPVVREFYEPFEKQLAHVAEKAERVKVAVEETEEKCPQCQSPLVIRLGRFGKFLACSRFPECRFTKTLVTKIETPCPKCGGDLLVKRTKKNRPFYGCANYPKCDFASWTKPKAEGNESKSENQTAG